MARVRLPRRPVEWYDTIKQGEALASGGQTEFDLLVNMEDRQNKGATITRIILNLDIRPLSVNTYTQVYVGLTLWSQEAFLTGIMPDADDAADMGVGWMYRGRLWSLVSSLNDAPGIGGSLQLDLRSQRKLTSEDQSLFIVLDAVAATNLTIDFLARVLVKHR